MQKRPTNRGIVSPWRDAFAGRQGIGREAHMLDTPAAFSGSKAVWAAVGAVLLINCATASGTMPSPGQLAAGGVAASEADVAALGRGRALVVTECATCHRLYWPREYSAEAWPGIVRKMGPRASLTEDQMQDLSVYLVTASRAARKTEGLRGKQEQTMHRAFLGKSPSIPLFQRGKRGPRPLSKGQEGFHGTSITAPIYATRSLLSDLVSRHSMHA